MANYGYGRGRGAGIGRGRWPGNGPFRNLPPWERPGWLYGPGSCWTLGYRIWSPQDIPLGVTPDTERRILENQQEMLQQNLESIQNTLKTIQERLAKLEE
ncbi:MAG: hypothetical protein ACFFAY_12065 [Promethearchaeota archaeon]